MIRVTAVRAAFHRRPPVANSTAKVFARLVIVGGLIYADGTFVLPKIKIPRAIPMKAVRFHQHGGPDVLKFEDAPDPKIQANEVLVRVKACALNHLDLFLRAGVRSWTLPMPHIVGSDISG